MGSGYAAYSNAHLSFLKGRDLEGAALAKAAHKLEIARSRPGDARALGEALDFNTKLWTVFQADVSDEDSPLPEDLRASLLGLALFMDQATASLLSGAVEADTLQAMIDVNRSLASGLFQDAEVES